MPSFTADFFGAKYMGGIYGWILLAWGARRNSVSHSDRPCPPDHRDVSPAIHVIAIVMVCSLVLPLIARRPKHEPGEPVSSMPGQRAA